VPIVEVSEAERPAAAAILLHPHPALGGDRFNLVVDALYRGLPPAGISAARFDFRSADPAEAAADVVAVLDQTLRRPVVLVGYSFGADVAATVTDGRLAGWFLIAPPLRLTDEQTTAVGTDPRPKGLAVPEHDQFSPSAAVSAVVAGWRNATVGVVPGTDHFLSGGYADVVSRAIGWLRSSAIVAGDSP
jgi:uncharacterized protein